MTTLNIWFEQGNQELYSGKKVEMQELHAPTSGAGGKVTT